MPAYANKRWRLPNYQSEIALSSLVFYSESDYLKRDSNKLIQFQIDIRDKKFFSRENGNKHQVGTSILPAASKKFKTARNCLQLYLVLEIEKESLL